MTRLFASDYDGTVRIGSVSERTHEAIRRFRASGGVFGIVTGRSAQISRQIFDEVESDFISCCNGAMLLLPDGGSVAYGHYGADAVWRLWDLAVSLGSVGLGPQAEDSAQWIPTDGTEGKERLARFLGEHPTVCQCNMLFGGYAPAAQATQVIADELGDTVNPLQNGTSVDIPPRGIDKAFGVRRAAGYFGVAEDMIYAAGNEMNDYSMVSAFHGFAMVGSPEELVSAAEHVIGDIADAIGIIG